MISENDLLYLRTKVEERMSPKRYAHTVGVEKMAVKLGQLLLPGKLSELRAAALLHDVTKEISFEEQTLLSKRFDYDFTEDDLKAPQILHSLTAQYAAMTEFSEFATDEIISAITKHTLGDVQMSIFDEIIFISDFIEEGRKYESSVKTRDFLLSSIEDLALSERINRLHRACLMSVDYTVGHLMKEGRFVHPQMIKTKNALLALI